MQSTNAHSCSVLVVFPNIKSSQSPLSHHSLPSLIHCRYVIVILPQLSVRGSARAAVSGEGVRHRAHAAQPGTVPADEGAAARPPGVAVVRAHSNTTTLPNSNVTLTLTLLLSRTFLDLFGPDARHAWSGA